MEVAAHETEAANQEQEVANQDKEVVVAQKRKVRLNLGTNDSHQRLRESSCR